jgi:transcriptional regulator with XRE-family HTH domain
MNDLVRKNLKKFRDEAGMTTEQAAQISKLSVDNIRRYESGKSGVPSEVLRRLAVIYGHSMDDFFLEAPPKARLTERPVFHLMTMPGTEVDQKKFRELQDMIDKANAEMRPKKK